MRILRAAVAHVPRDPAVHGASALEAWADAGLAVGDDGRVAALDDWVRVRARFPAAPVDDRRGALVLPGLVDAHVHYPQVGIIGALGHRLLAWLETRTLPHEARFADPVFARAEARTFLRLLARNGTTTALVFGAHYAGAMEAFFQEAAASGLRLAAGLCVADHGLRPDLLTTPEAAYEEATLLARRWHGHGRLRYAVTPRFSLSSSPHLLAACGEVAREAPGVLVTSHLNETPEEVAVVRSRFPEAGDYLATYEAAGLVGPRSVFAHDLYPSDDELRRLAVAGASVAHCPSSNQFLGSGLFPWRRHRAHGVAVALGTDVGAGLGPSALHEASLAYLGQMLRGDDGVPLGAAHLLYLATSAGASALGLADEAGDLGPGRAADLVVLRPPPGSTLAAVWRHAEGAEDLVGAAFMLAREEAVESTWVAGEAVWEAASAATTAPADAGAPAGAGGHDGAGGGAPW